MLSLGTFIVIVLKIQSLQASFCGTGAVPFRLEVLPSGALSLGCAVPTCFGGEEGGADVHQHNSEFNPSDESANKKDGFIRESDAQRPRFRQSTAPSQRAACEDVASSLACDGPNQWIGGIDATTKDGGPLKLRCCTYAGLDHSRLLESQEIGENEALLGGEVISKNRQTAFDVISNVQKITSDNEQVKYQVSVRRMPCIPDPKEVFNEVDPAIEQDIEEISLPQQGPQGPPQGPQGPPQAPFFAQNAFVGAPAAFAPAAPAPAGFAPAAFAPAAYAPAAYAPAGFPGFGGGNIACFSSDMLLATKTGQTKRMDELKIGDEILSATLISQPTFVPVESFLHRLPRIKTRFVRIETSDGSFIKLTPQHIIYVLKHKEGELLPARDVKLGDKLLRKNENEFSPTTVTNITIVEEIGAYAPITSNGLIAINGLVASCHSVNNMLSLQHTFFRFMRQFDFLSSLWQTGSHSLIDDIDDIVDLPMGTWSLLSVLEYIIPNAPLMSSV